MSARVVESITSRLHTVALVADIVARALRTGKPRPTTTAERLADMPTAGLPLREAVDIRWDAHLVPSIEAANEWDLAVALGAVQAHLRLAQMEAMRRLATGRVAEVIGPAGIEVDRALRLMRFDAAVPAIEAMLPAATRQWAEGFVAGVNHHIAHARRRPYELDLLGAAVTPWTLRDLLLVTRFAAADVSWMVFASLLRSRDAMPVAEWDALWPKLQGGDVLPWPERIEDAALALVRGSNSVAVSASRSAGGAGMIASDPHLGVTLPPLWLIAGLHAPGFDVVGLMLPGLPLVGLGRSRWLAWGGTSLHAASSDLIDVSGEPVTEREEVIQVRGQAPVTLRLRETRFGPMVSDGMLLRSGRPLALRWVGHAPSDELTALLGVMRARTVAEFRAALGGFAVPGQTMVAVEAGPAGRATRVIAAHLPRRADAPMAGLVAAPATVWGLDDLVPGAAFALPAEAIVASANDRPEATPVPVGFFFSPPVRARRLRTLLDRPAPVELAAMRAVQLDVAQPGALALRDALLSRLPPVGPRRAAAVLELAAWDGSYDAASAGALVFEAMVAALARRIIPKRTLVLLSAIWSGRALIRQRIADARPGDLHDALGQAASVLRRYRNWGGAHRLSLRHPFAALPVVGSWFALRSHPAPGGNDTLYKTGHGLVRGRHRVTFGSCARHVSEMADPDANWFVLLGGQDGWLGSANAADQVALWEAGEAIQVPLRPEAAHGWPYQTRLLP